MYLLIEFCINLFKVHPHTERGVERNRKNDLSEAISDNNFYFKLKLFNGILHASYVKKKNKINR